MKYNGQAEQDKFVLKVLNEKRNGYFLEIGSNDPIYINNTYILEKEYGWKGIMIEYNNYYLNSYKIIRPSSIHIIEDATKIDYKKIFKEENNMPLCLDYLQIDLDVVNKSTIDTLIKLDNEIFDIYKFATITFEHDIYQGDYFNTRMLSRDIFKKRGYISVFEDICNRDMSNNNLNPFEDWYVHPDLVDMNYINNLIDINKNNYDNNVIEWQNIQYI